MANPELHIVCFDVPTPPDYGGAIDVYYKIRSLHQAGCIIYLHCFQYGRAEAPELLQWCKEVWYYKRKTGSAGISLSLPYIVYSRRSSELLKRLIEIDAPVLFEGAHCSYYLNHPALSERYKMVRAHNVEHQYYRQLSERTTNLLQRAYFYTEAMLLKRYEQRLFQANAIFTLSLTDKDFFTSLYPAAKVQFVAPFHPYTEVASVYADEKYGLYHGNLSHPENAEVAMYLIREIIPNADYPFIIAGRNPTDNLRSACKGLKNCRLIANPDANEMGQLIRNAHMHLMLTFQPTGMKLKLLFALFSGAHVIANKDMVQGTGLEECAVIVNNNKEIIAAITSLKDHQVTQAQSEMRNALLDKYYNNNQNAKRILTYLPLRSL